MEILENWVGERLYAQRTRLDAASANIGRSASDGDRLLAMSFMPPSPARGESVRQTDHEIQARANAYAARHPDGGPARRGSLRRLRDRLTHGKGAQPKPD